MAKLTIERVSDIANNMGFIFKKGICRKGGRRRQGYMLIDKSKDDVVGGIVCGVRDGFPYTAKLREVADFLEDWDSETFDKLR